MYGFPLSSQQSFCSFFFFKIIVLIVLIVTLSTKPIPLFLALPLRLHQGSEVGLVPSSQTQWDHAGL